MPTVHSPSEAGLVRTPPPSGRRRQRTLARVYDARLRQLGGMQLALILGWAISAGFALMMLVLTAHDAAAHLDMVALRGLGVLSWAAAGVAALSAAQNLHQLDQSQGVSALALQRGFDALSLRRARVVASVRRIATVTGGPALCLALLALALSPASAVRNRVLLCAGVCGYVALLAVVLGLLARWSAALSPTRGRALLCAVVLGPALARLVWPLVPSVPALFGWLLNRLASLGAGVA